MISRSVKNNGAGDFSRNKNHEMVRTGLTIIIALHGIIHLIGFSKEWKLGPGGGHFDKTLIPLSDEGSKLTGILWLASCILMIAAAYFYFDKKEWYWIPALAGLIISQGLIILYWQDAKYGTIGNVILAFIIIVGAASMYYKKMVHLEIKTMTNQSYEQQLITEADIINLPAPVQRWLIASGVIGTEIPKIVHMVQRGSMRTKPDAAWMPFTAEQYFTIQEPAFVWEATIQASFLPIAGRDKFIGGHGNMLIKPLYIYTAANSIGPEIDQGTLVRYLAEIIWFPQAAVSKYLTWEAIDNDHARVTMNYKGLTASGSFMFNNDGDVIGFEAQRYGDFGGELKKERWSIATGNHTLYNGIRTGRTSNVTWKLKEGDFHWLKLEVLDIRYMYKD